MVRSRQVANKQATVRQVLKLSGNLQQDTNPAAGSYGDPGYPGNLGRSGTEYSNNGHFSGPLILVMPNIYRAKQFIPGKCAITKSS